MPSSYYTHATGKPYNQSRGLASEVRYELDSIAASFGLLPSPTALASGSINYALDTGLSNAYVVSVSSAVTAYADGFSFFFKPINSNSGASTLNVNTLGLKAIIRPNGTAVQAGDIVANQILKLTYNSSYNGFQLDTDISYANQAAASASAAATSAASTAGAIVAERSASRALTNLTGLTVVSGGASITGATTIIAGNDALALTDTSATTGFKAIRLRSTTGGIDIGVQNNAGTWVSGATANDAVIVGRTGISFSANDGAATHSRLDASGNFLVGTSTYALSNSNNLMLNASGGALYAQHASGAASGTAYSIFAYNATQIGSITQSGTTAVAYNTTSDYRLKTNIRPADAKRFMSIKFHDYEWIDGRHDCGPLAHELQEIYPDLVTGKKDATETRTVEITPAVPAVTEQVLVSEAVLNDEGEEIEAAVYETVEVTPAIPAVTEEQEFPVYQQVNMPGLIGRMGTRVQALQRTVDAQTETIEALIARIEALEARA